MSADRAYARRSPLPNLSPHIVGGVVSGIFRIHFSGQPLRGLHRRRNFICTRLRAPHLGLQPAVQLIDLRALLRRICWRTGGSRFFVVIHESDYSAAEGILALAPPPLLSAGKLDLPLDFGGHAIASRRAISPAAHDLQHIPIPGQSRAFQNQRAVHTAIGSDNEADLHSTPIRRRCEHRIGGRQCFRRLYVLANGARADVRHADELRGSYQPFCRQTLAACKILRVEICRSRLSGEHANSNREE